MIDILKRICSLLPKQQVTRTVIQNQNAKTKRWSTRFHKAKLPTTEAFLVFFLYFFFLCSCILERFPLLEDEVHPVKKLQISLSPKRHSPSKYWKKNGDNFTNNCPGPQNDAHCAKNRSLGQLSNARPRVKIARQRVFQHYVLVLSPAAAAAALTLRSLSQQ